MAYDCIAGKILSGELQPGEHILAGQIAEAIGLSRTPVLAALQTLTAQGLVQHQRNRGCFVAKYSLQEMVEIYEAREVIEGVAARTMAIRGEASVIAGLREICTSLELAEQTGPAIAMSSYDFEFHQYLMRNGGNGFLGRGANGDELIVMALLRGLPILRALSRGDGPCPSNVPHAAIVDAIEAGDSVAAEEVARRHIREALEVYRQYWQDVYDLLTATGNLSVA
ncbi:MAG: GntR family transcriptional regulator [Armatimonadetes bacterium]|nr:GntR family transcriptional regulator [Armatimonadota bacterium]